MNINDFVQFHGDRLFSGAINLDWYFEESALAEEVAASYIFHGKKYNTSNNKLIDSISLTEEILKNIVNIKERQNAISLIIAGYGSGKSHFALMLASLLNKNKNVYDKVIENIATVDRNDSEIIDSVLQNKKKRTLILPINGIRNCNLYSEFFKIASKVIFTDGFSTIPLRQFEIKYSQLLEYMKIHKNENLMLKIIKKFDLAGFSDLEDAMNAFDEDLYEKLLHELKLNGFNLYFDGINQDKQLQDLLTVLATNYCAGNGPYDSILILFDEFGKYLSFSCAESAKAGMGIMQNLFDGIIQNKNYINLIGFSQLELKEYKQTLKLCGPAVTNEIDRYITRYDIAKKYYLSINFEQLIANLLEKNVDFSKIDYINNKDTSNRILNNLKSSFPLLSNYDSWNNSEEFKRLILKGCWPLSPYSMFLLTFLSSVNNILQQRSTFNLLNAVIESLKDQKVSTPNDIIIYPYHFYQNGLNLELTNSESFGLSTDTIAKNYDIVFNKYGHLFTDEEIIVLQTIVILNKVHPKINSKDFSITTISDYCGLPINVVNICIQNLSCGKFSVLKFDTTSSLFTIIASGVTLQDFDVALQEEINKIKENNIISELVEQTILNDISIISRLRNNNGFGEKNNIKSDEFSSGLKFYQLSKLRSQLKLGHKSELVNEVFNAKDVTDNRCLTVASYFQDGNIDSTIFELKQLLMNCCYFENDTIYPIIIVLLNDNQQLLSNNIITIKALEQLKIHKEEEYINFFANKERALESEQENIFNAVLKESIKITPIIEDSEFRNLKQVQNYLLNKLYSKVISFPVEGFKDSTRGNKICEKIIKILSGESPNWNKFLQFPSADLNNAKALLLNCWGVFDYNSQLVPLSVTPQDNNLNQLFLLFTEIIDTRKSIALKKLFDIATLPPFGANTNAASIIIVLYLAMKHYSLKVNNTIIPQLADYINSNPKFLIKGRIAPPYLSEIEIFKPSDDENAWQRLFEEYNAALTYKEKINCAAESQNLINSGIPTPPRLMGAYTTMTFESEKAKQEIASYNNSIEQFVTMEEVFLKRGTGLTALAKNIKALLNYNNKMQDGKSCWSEEDFDIIDNHIEEGLVQVQNSIQTWIERHQININSSNYDSLLNDYIYFSKLLTDISLNDCATIIKEESARVQAKIQQVQKKQAVIRTYNIKSSTIKNTLSSTNSLNESQLKNLLKEGKDIQNFLSKYPDIDLTKESDEISIYINKLTSKLNTMQSEFEELLDYQISKVSDLFLLKEKLQLFNGFYYGTKNYDDVIEMSKEISNLMSFNNSISNYKTLSELTIFVDSFKQSLEDLDEIYFNDEEFADYLFNINSVKIKQKSKEKLRIYIQSYASISTMKEAIFLKNQIENDSSDLTYEDKKELNLKATALTNFISAKKVESLIENYNNLNETEKERFIKAIKNS